MTIEQNLKTIIGEQAFNIAVISAQLEEANNKIKELETEGKKNGTSSK